MVFLQKKKLKINAKNIKKKLIKSKGIIPEGRSFHETPNGFSCLDCAKITNQGHQGRILANDNPNYSAASASADSHPVNITISVQ